MSKGPWPHGFPSPLKIRHICINTITFVFLSGWSFQTGQLKLVKLILNVEVQLALFLPFFCSVFSGFTVFASPF